MNDNSVYYVYELWYEWKMPHHLRKRKYTTTLISNNVGRSVGMLLDFDFVTVTGLRPIRTLGFYGYIAPPKGDR